MFDYHVHTEFSVDCKVPMADSCRAAIAAGITEIAFTDHVDHMPTDPGFGYYRPDAYFRALDEVRREFGDRLTVLAGAEVDFHTDTAEEVGTFIERYGKQYDFVIGSVHYASGGAIIFPEVFAGRSLDEIFLPYFDQVQAAVETGWFDSIGHLDIPKRYLPKTHRTYDPLAYRERLQRLFAAMISRGVAFEINTSGLRQAPKTSMPGPAIVRWYVEAGGTLITTGTDSHAAQTVGAGIAKTLDMLELCGIPAVASFRERTPKLVPIAQLRRRAQSAA
ncbi:MAG: histidinol phosphate phosphatase [Thermomicrobiales bacterium]|nr:MAG: histidinol phosphate phosphatase [Thermomicrobiales bacterium]